MMAAATMPTATARLLGRVGSSHPDLSSSPGVVSPSPGLHGLVVTFRRVPRLPLWCGLGGERCDDQREHDECRRKEEWRTSELESVMWLNGPRKAVREHRRS